MALAEKIQEAGLVVIRRLIGVLQAPEASVGDHIKRLIAVSPGQREDDGPAQVGRRGDRSRRHHERRALGMDMARGTVAEADAPAVDTGSAMDIVRKLDLSLGLQLRKVVAAHLEARRDSRFAGDVLHIMERIADFGAAFRSARLWLEIDRKSTGRRCVVELKVRVMFVGVVPALRQPKL